MAASRDARDRAADRPLSEDVEGEAVRRLASVPAPEVSDQLGMDERVVEDDALAKLLDARLRAKDDVREVRGVYKAADVAAKDAIAKLDLADGDAVRVGRFRITKRATEPRHVEFDAAAGSRLTIELWAK